MWVHARVLETRDISVASTFLALVSAAMNMANRPHVFFLKHHTEREMPSQALAVLVILTQAADV